MKPPTKKPFHLQAMKKQPACPEPSIKVAVVIKGEAARLVKSKADMAGFLRELVEEHMKSLDAGKPTCKGSRHGPTAST